jgi:hypothetical protein
VPVSSVAGAVAANSLTVWVASGGWCDFYEAQPRIDATLASVARQVEICRALGIRVLRLFFGRLARATSLLPPST